MLDNGFPYESYPTGWFQVAWADDLAAGDVRPLHYFGRDLVLYRDEAGEPHVLDAHCPHMGAHLGVGGKVQGCDLVCPFHEWVWSPEGTNVSIPNEDRPNRTRSIRTWQTRIANGIVWLWHDELEREPTWEPPAEIPGNAEGRFYPLLPHFARRYERIRVLPQWITENNADVSHLWTVHRASGPIEQEFEIQGPMLRSRTTMVFGYGKPSSRLTPTGPQEGALVAELWGVGIIKILFEGLDEAWLIQSQVPVDKDHSDIFVTTVIPCGENPPDEPDERALARFREQCVQLERDFPIWENLRYVVNGPLTRHEAKHVAPLRRWARQFYPDAPAVDAVDDVEAVATVDEAQVV